MFKELITTYYGGDTNPPQIIDTCFAYSRYSPHAFSPSSYMGHQFIIETYRDRYLNIARALRDYYVWCQSKGVCITPLHTLEDFLPWYFTAANIHPANRIALQRLQVSVKRYFAKE